MSRGCVYTDAIANGDRIWLDNQAVISGLTHQSTYPGGASQASWQINLDPRSQHRAWLYGRKVGIALGGDRNIWRGYMDNPSRGTTWTMNAVGRASQAMQYLAIAATSGNALNLNEVIDAAITRGLPFTRNASLPTLSSTAPTAPSGSITIAEALDQVAAGQATETYWQTDTAGVITMSAAPTTPTYILYATTPGGGRSLDGFATDAYVVYQSASGVISVNHRTTTSQPFGTFEATSDQTSLGLIPSSQANNLGDGFLSRNAARLKFTDAFTVTHGQLVNLGGQAVDLATVRAGCLVNVILTDPDSAGEVALGPVPQILVGICSYDWDSDTLTLTPTYSAQDTLTALLGAGSLTA